MTIIEFQFSDGSSLFLDLIRENFKLLMNNDVCTFVVPNHITKEMATSAMDTLHIFLELDQMVYELITGVNIPTIDVIREIYEQCEDITQFVFFEFLGLNLEYESPTMILYRSIDKPTIKPKTDQIVLYYLFMSKYTKTNKLFVHACANGHLDSAKWLWQHFFKDALQSFNAKTSELDNSTDLETTNPVKSPHQYLRKAFYSACENNFIEMAQWLNELIEEEGRQILHVLDLHELIIHCCRFGFLPMAMWLYTLDTEDLIGDDTMEMALIDACNSPQENLEVVEWLISVGRSDVPGDGGNDAMVKCTKYDHLNIIKVLHSAKANIQFDDNFLFFEACSNGALNIAKWLFEEIMSTTDLPLNYLARNHGIDGFVTACRRGYVKMVKWLIHRFEYDMEELTQAFMDACFNNQFETAEMLFRTGKVNKVIAMINATPTVLEWIRQL
jgi:hypothetical protein